MKFEIRSIKVEIGRQRAGLICIENKNWDPKTTKKWAAMHFLVKPYFDVYYKDRGGRLEEVEAYWVWGWAIEQYDCNGDYFGLGPLFLMCW